MYCFCLSICTDNLCICFRLSIISRCTENLRFNMLIFQYIYNDISVHRKLRKTPKNRGFLAFLLCFYSLLIARRYLAISWGGCSPPQTPPLTGRCPVPSRLVPTARPLELVFCSVSPSVMYFEHTPLQNSQGALYALYEALRALDSFWVYAIHKIPTELGAKYISPEGLILPPGGGHWRKPKGG